MLNKILILLIIAALIFVFKPYQYIPFTDDVQIQGDVTKDIPTITPPPTVIPTDTPLPTPTIGNVQATPRPLTNEDIRDFCKDICGDKGFTAYVSKLEYKYFECDCKDKSRFYIDYYTLKILSKGEVFDRDKVWIDGKKA